MTIHGGTEGVGQALKALIETYLVDELRQMEQERGFGQGTLSVSPEGGNGPTRITGLVPRLVSTAERPELDLNQYPAVLILTEGVPSSQYRGVRAPKHDPEGPETLDGECYERIYGVRLMVYVLGVGWEETRTNRDRMEYALWRCLMRSVAIAPDMVIEQNTMSTTYTDVTAAEAGKMQTGFRMRINVRVEELISLAPGPVANTIDSDVERFF